MEDFLWIKLKILLCLCICLSANEVVARDLFCPGGHHTLVCSTNHLFLEWNVTTTSQHSPSHERSVSLSDQNPVILPIRVIATNFEFSRDSPYMTLPLISTMTIENVNSYLEGTIITCTGLNSSSVSSVALMVTMHIFDVSRDVPNPPDIILRTDFDNNTFTVVLEWSKFSGETYNVTTIPEPIGMNFITSNSVRLVMIYNTEYNVTVTATLCGHRNASNFTTIHYAQCDSLLMDARIDIIGTLPALQGQNFTISCSGALWTSQCSEGGRWDPDPKEVCKIDCSVPGPLSISVSLNYSFTLEDSTLQFSCEEGYLPSDVIIATCHPNGSWVPDPASHVCTTVTPTSGTPSISDSVNRDSVAIIATTVTIVPLFTVLLIVFFIIGCIYTIRWRGRKNINPQSDPLYDEIPLSAVNPQVQKKGFELKQNDSYGQISTCTQSKL